MSSARPIPPNDDHGDQFPGALPAATTPPADLPAPADDRLVRMNAAYTAKINAAVQAGRENLAHELAERTFAEELAAPDTAVGPTRRPAGHRSRGHRPPTALGRMRTLTRRSLRRFDSYTLDVFNPRPPHALYSTRPDRSR